jgi:hypothetical protein
MAVAVARARLGVGLGQAQALGAWPRLAAGLLVEAPAQPRQRAESNAELRRRDRFQTGRRRRYAAPRQARHAPVRRVAICSPPPKTRTRAWRAPSPHAPGRRCRPGDAVDAVDGVDTAEAGEPGDAGAVAGELGPPAEPRVVTRERDGRGRRRLREAQQNGDDAIEVGPAPRLARFRTGDILEREDDPLAIIVATDQPWLPISRGAGTAAGSAAAVRASARCRAASHGQVAASITLTKTRWPKVRWPKVRRPPASVSRRRSRARSHPDNCGPVRSGRRPVARCSRVPARANCSQRGRFLLPVFT